ncbi:hypothetical protein [Paenibacillus pedocola]|uniref:hypothetical protein n=1 Tax=Paenibacillus pedocola TaxID=3242193 RepID=UPI002877D6E1|nr:hypothetical protein [Paenibacillus typhae]
MFKDKDFTPDFAEFPALIGAIAAVRLTVNAAASPLSKVEEAWNEPSSPGPRAVFVPATN